MIYFFQPQMIDGSLGKGYNHYMELLPKEDDWAVLTDQDTMFLSPAEDIILKAISEYPDTGIFTCYTNRIGNKSQLAFGQMSEDSSVISHRVKALKLREQNLWRCNDIKTEISGMLMVIQKKVWNKLRFSEDPGLLGIDNDFSARVLGSGYKIRLITGLYIFHYYRLMEGANHREHLKIKA